MLIENGIGWLLHLLKPYRCHGYRSRGKRKGIGMEPAQEKARRALADVLQVSERDIKVNRPIGGMTNRNFLCTCVGKSYVVRVPGEGTAQMVNRMEEKYYTEVAVDLDWHPALLYFGEDGIKITEYVECAQTLEEGRGRERLYIEKVANLLRNLHHSRIEERGCFSFDKEYRRYWNMVENKRAVYQSYPDFVRMEALVPVWEERLSELGIESCPCHNDLVPENWIIQGERLYLLDWEYAGYNDPAWDLASYMSEGALSKEARDDLLRCYFSSGFDGDRWEEKILIYEGLQHILWFVWTMAKEECGVYFHGYAKKRLAGAVATLQEGHKKYGWSI